jgi:hypothetical protein
MFQRLLLALIAGLLVWPSLIQAQPPANRSPDDPGASWRYDFLQLLLEERQLRVDRSLQSAFGNPKSSVVVVGNDGDNALRMMPSVIVDYVEQGGAILIMHELNGVGRADVLALAGIGSFFKGPVTALRPEDTYEGFNDCVRVSEVRDREGLFSDVRMLITNRAGWFKPSEAMGWDWETVATFPVHTEPTKVQPKRLLCIGRPKNSNGGIAIVLSDSSMLTNNMIFHGDNSRLALHLAEVFQQQGRDRFVMLRNNISLDSISNRIAERMRQEQERMQQQNLPRPKPTLAQWLEMGNLVAKEVVDSNVINEALQRQPRNVAPERYFRFLVTLLVAASLIWILWKLLTSTSLRELWLARRRQRHAYEIQSGNEAGDYRTAAGFLAQEFCIQWTGSHHSRQWQQALATLVRQPPITAVDRNALVRVVDIASRGCHERMSGPEFQKFGNTLEALRRLMLA